jgi:hypothetical protein
MGREMIVQRFVLGCVIEDLVIGKVVRIIMTKVWPCRHGARRRSRRAVKETAGVMTVRVLTQAPYRAVGVAPLPAREVKEAAKVAWSLPEP